MILPAVTFVVFLAGILAAYWFFVLRPEQQSLGIVRRRMSPTQAVKASLHRELVKQDQAYSSVRAFDVLLRRSQRQTQPLNTLIQQAGVKATVGTIMAASALLALIAYVAVMEYTGWLVLAAPVAAVLAITPFSVLKQLRTRRMRKFEEQFPEALDLLSRAIRAGHAFQTAMGMVAEELPAPVGVEFKKSFEEQNFGLPLKEALDSLAVRMPLMDVKFFVTAVQIQRETGGNLAEILDNLASVVRERFKILRQVRVHTAHGRFTSYVLLALPALLACALMWINPEHMGLLFSERIGQMMVLGAIVMQTIGYFWIRQVIKIEV